MQILYVFCHCYITCSTQHHKAFYCCVVLCKGGLCHHAVSVCISVTFVNSVKTSNLIFQFFYSSDSQTILVFPYQTSWQSSDGDHLTFVECRWGRHRSRFWMKSLLSIDDCCSVRSTIDCRRRTSVSQLQCTSVYGTDRCTSVNMPKGKEQNRIYLYASVNLRPK